MKVKRKQSRRRSTEGKMATSWRLRRLDDSDVKTVLDALQLPSHLRKRVDCRELQVAINACIPSCDSPLSDEQREQTRQHSLPSAKLKRYERLRGALQQAVECLRDDDTHFHWPGTPRNVLAGQISKYLCSLDEEIAALRQALAVRRQKGPKGPNLSRYAFVEHLADTFEATFNTRATLYLDGGWCRFLAAVLSCCQLEAIGNEGARSLWKQVVKQRSSTVAPFGTRNRFAGIALRGRAWKPIVVIKLMSSK